jgi:hypothetical protein
MTIPKCRLNAADMIVHDSQKVEIQAVNQHTVLWKASEQIELPRSSQTVRLKSRPGRQSAVYPVWQSQGKLSDNIGTNYRRFRKSLRWYTHSQIITATIERPSGTFPGAPCLVNTLYSTNSPRPTPHKPTQSLCIAKRPRCVPVDDGSPP